MIELLIWLKPLTRFAQRANHARQAHASQNGANFD